MLGLNPCFDQSRIELKSSVQILSLRFPIWDATASCFPHVADSDNTSASQSGGIEARVRILIGTAACPLHHETATADTGDGCALYLGNECAWTDYGKRAAAYIA